MRSITDYEKVFSMKRFIFTMLLGMTVIPVCAQTDKKERISFATTVGTGISMNVPSSTPVMWQALGYYNLTRRWSVGVGTGLSFYEKVLVPLYGDVRFQIGRERKFTPYAEFAIGGAFAPANDANGGFFMNPSIGVQYPLKNKMKLQLAVGYEWQELKRLKKQTDPYFVKEFEEVLYHNSISIKAGILF